MKRRFPIVEVIWHDATELDGWKDGNEPEDPKPCPVLSVGYLVHKCKDYIVLAQDVAHDGDRCGRGQIPRAMIKTLRVIKKKDADSKTK